MTTYLKRNIVTMLFYAEIQYASMEVSEPFHSFCINMLKNADALGKSLLLSCVLLCQMHLVIVKP